MSQAKLVEAPVLIFSQYEAILSTTLEEISCPFLLAKDAAALLEQESATKPLLIILDDIELCARVRPQIHARIFLLVTADKVNAALDAGADDCLILPLNPRLLQQRVKNRRHSSHSEQNQQDSEYRYRSLFEGANDAILLIDIETGRVAEANPQAAKLLGYSQAELLGLPISALESLNLETVRESTTPDFGAVHPVLVEGTFKRNDGRTVPVEISSRVIRAQGRSVLVSFLRDISARKRAYDSELTQRHLAEALLETANALNSSLDLETVLDSILDSSARIVPEVLSANIMMIRGEMVELVRHRGYEYLEMGDTLVRGSRFRLTNMENLRWVLEQRQALAIPDVHNSPFQWGDNATADYIQSVVSAPIIVDGQVIGFINLDSNQRDTFDSSHAQVLQAFANQAATAIQKARLFEQTQSYAQDLEKRIAERTEQLAKLQTDLSNERNLLRTIVDTLPDTIYVKDRESRFVLVNKAALRRQGISDFKEVVGKTDFDFLGDIAQSLRDSEIRIMNTREAQINKPEYVYHHGEQRYLLITKIPFTDDSGEVLGLVGVNHDITELKEIEMRLEQVLRGARCLLWSATVEQDENDEFQWSLEIVNESAAQNFFPLDVSEKNYTEAWLAAIHPEDRSRREYVFQTHIEFNRYHYTQEFRLTLRDGKERWLLEDVLIQETGEKRWLLVGVCTDISERKQAELSLQHLNVELELRVQARTQDLVKANEILRREIMERRRAEESERRQRILAEALRDSIAKLSSTLDRNVVFDYLLSTIRPIVPHDAANIMLLDGKTMEVVRAWGYTIPLTGSRFEIEHLPDFQAVLDTGKPFIIPDTRDYEHWRNANDFTWILSNITIPIHLDGTIIGFLNLDSAVVDNFTAEQADWLVGFANQAGIAIRNARYTAELEAMVHQRTQALELEQAQLKAILDAMRDGVVYTDLERRPHYINQALSDITGYSQEEWLQGTAQKSLNTEPEELRIETWRKVERILEYQGYWAGESSLRHQDGHYFDASLIRTAVKDSSGQRIGIVTVARDISEEKRLEEQKARFITVAAHELRTPITNLKTRLFLLQRQPERLHDHLVIIEKVVNWMQSLVEDMFDLSRFERGIMLLNRETLTLQDLLKEAISYHEPEAERLHIRLHLLAPENPIAIRVDANRLTQVFSNLIANALRYTPNGGEVRLELSQEAHAAHIQIIDNGKGIHAAHLPHIFEPFFRATEEGKGAGLGLAVVKEIIDLHGGTIGVSSEEGKGTRFSIKLPLGDLPHL